MDELTDVDMGVSDQINSPVTKPSPVRIPVEGTTSKHADRISVWHDVFVNLLLVAVFSNLGSYFEAGYKNNLAWYYPYVSYFAIFMPMWLHWHNSTLYSNRFKNTTDGIHQFFNFVNTMLVLGASLNVTSCSTVGYLSGTYDCAGFSYFMVLLKVLLVVMFSRVAVLSVNARSFALVRVAMHASVGIIWLFVATVGPLNTYVFAMLWWAAIFVDVFWNPVVTLMRKYWSPKPVPAKIEHLEERLGLLVMLSVGQIIAVASFSSLEQDKYMVYLNAGLVTGIAFLIKTVYHDVGLTYAREGVHAIKRHVLSAFCWIWLQIPLLFSIFVVSCTLRYAIEGKLAEYTTCRWAMLLSMSLTLLSMTGMQACHIKPKRAQITRIRLEIRMIVRMVCSGIILLFGFFPGDWLPDPALLSLIVITLCVTTSVDVFGRQRTSNGTNEEEETQLLA
mmetsp:Transcript_15838/g.61887  ORF Transcript_15838/g.61887 Transcript_15838/m.61887 type:complete len:447 (-) Transcript_15838:41-1381(-)|eukprot:CAMPEP_0114624516 /NCGR_PEP_ID=MMETSP0168-20121206/10805_1 /TAXON_ID=95228 ORGANISM="Vannella sp., Strain DIVA3 517/6/12" /NCGR_SAMPLE_ID=MMETSP0168 /ASSEMBLY_ACC=CAM_ASM_000044 /LENGTH=446 /DNA_ID=CAMNT_0001835789 /DNA_START=148 /DNA_END=1488 /DNA_ORIENTATION=-